MRKRRFDCQPRRRLDVRPRPQSAINLASLRHRADMKLGLYKLGTLSGATLLLLMGVACEDKQPSETHRDDVHAGSGGSDVSQGGAGPMGGSGAVDSGGGMTDANTPLPSCPDTPRFNEAGQKLVFCDDFLGDELDRSKWQMERGMLRNQEEQCYLDRPENIIVESGELTIRAIPETVDDPICTREWNGVQTQANYSSASVTSKDFGVFRYGRIEARLKVPAATGAWPAFWLLPQEWVYGGWPESGEIDVMEYVSQDPNQFYGTIHYEFLGHKEDGNAYVLDEPVSNDFHIVAIDWTPTKIDWFLDGNHYHSFDTTPDIQGRRPFDESFYMIFNLAVGGTWPEDPVPSDYPAEYKIDWVRVYQSE